jgi:hypothetical protein
VSSARVTILVLDGNGKLRKNLYSTCRRLSEMLISNLIENANHQRFFSVHLPRLTNTSPEQDAVEAFSQLIIQKVLQS